VRKDLYLPQSWYNNRINSSHNRKRKHGTCSICPVGYFTCASFTSIFSAAINSFKENHGTISGILGTAIVGGAFISWLVGFTGQHLNMKWGMSINYWHLSTFLFWHTGVKVN